MASLDFGWCLSTMPILKWLEIIFCCIIIALVEICVRCWGGYGFMMFAAASCLALTFLTLILYFFKLHTGALNSLPWRLIEIAINVFGLIVFIISFALGIYQCVELFGNKVSYVFIDGRISHREWQNRMAATTAFCGMNMILYGLSAFYANRGFI